MNRSTDPRRLSVRTRTAAAAAAALVPVLTVAAVAGVIAQRHELTNATSLVAQERAGAVAQEVDAAADAPAAHLPAATVGSEQALFQLVTNKGDVVDSSGDLRGDTSLVTPTEVRSGEDTSQVVGNAVDEESDRVVAVAVSLPDGSGYVVAAQSLESVDAATASTTQLLAFGSVLVVLVVTTMTWFLTGRALRPVETMRARLADISAADLSARLSPPGTADEIERLAETMNGMLDRLERAADAQRRFVADASHELRSPIATIRALHETARLSPHPGGPDGQSREVLAETERLEHLVSDLLLLARSDAEPMPRTRRVDLSALVAEEVARARSVRVETRTTPDVGAAGNPEALGRLLRNLLDNAERHARTSVVVTLERAEGAVCLTVSDDGPGVPPAQRERIFERFVRLDDARARDEGGTGLGLAIARRIAVEHRGTLSLEGSRAGVEVGARFVFLVDEWARDL